jgi:hypothetical protein
VKGRDRPFCNLGVNLERKLQRNFKVRGREAGKTPGPATA